MLTRREFVTITGACLGSVLMSGCSAHNAPLSAQNFQKQVDQLFPALDIITSAPQEYAYEAKVEGTIPPGLNGTFYRNGPSLFERGGLRKRCFLDGDGMIQAFKIHDGRVRFQNKFVQTEKYIRESAAGKFLYATWSTQAPGGVMANFLGSKVKSQAGVTVVLRNGRLLAFDEFQAPYELDPETLETLGITWLGLQKDETVYGAHSKIDGKTGEWILYGIKYGPQFTLHFTIFDKKGRLKKHRKYPLPQPVYVHDFFVTDRHIIFSFPPVKFSFFDYLSGQTSLLHAMRWEPAEGNMILVFSREGDAEPVHLMTDSCWMWHSLNAFNEGGEIVADFVGYQNPDHLLGEDPAMCAIMSGRPGQFNFPGEIRRYTIDLGKKDIHQEIIAGGHHEFPFVNPHHVCHKHRFGYFAKNPSREIFFSGITRIDMKTLQSDSYDFGRGNFCSEPVFAPKPGHIYSSENNHEPGWLFSEVYNSHSGKIFLAIFNAQHVGAGPTSLIHLNHYVPIGFHGFWQPHR